MVYAYLFRMIKAGVCRGSRNLKVRLVRVVQEIAFIACLLHVPAHAEIYKWRDAKGIMNYADTPPPAGQQNTQRIKATTVSSEFPLTRSDAYKESEKPAADKGLAANQRRPENSPAVASDTMVNEMEARIRSQNCAAARSNYRNYAVGGRMQNVNEQGEKEYLTDEQIREGLAQAQRDIDENCPVE